MVNVVVLNLIFFVTGPTKSVQGALVLGPTTNKNLSFCR